VDAPFQQFFFLSPCSLRGVFFLFFPPPKPCRLPTPQLQPVGTFLGFIPTEAPYWVVGKFRVFLRFLLAEPSTSLDNTEFLSFFWPFYWFGPLQVCHCLKKEFGCVILPLCRFLWSFPLLLVCKRFFPIYLVVAYFFPVGGGLSSLCPMSKGNKENPFPQRSFLYSDHPYFRPESYISECLVVLKIWDFSLCAENPVLLTLLGPLAKILAFSISLLAYFFIPVLRWVLSLF